MKLIKIENNELILNEEVSEKLKRLYEFKADFDILMDALKNEMLEVMKSSNIKSFENDLIKVIYKAPSVRKTVDTQELKNQGLYDSFTKETKVKASVSVSYKWLSLLIKHILI